MYYPKVLKQGETLVHATKVHWKIYILPSLFLALGIGLMAYGSQQQAGGEAVPLTLLGLCIVTLAFISWMRAFYVRSTTEIIVTDRRVLFKKNWLAVKTREINLSAIETVDLRRSLLDWMLNAGQIIIVGRGGSWEPFPPVKRPIALRNAIGGR